MSAELLVGLGLLAVNVVGFCLGVRQRSQLQADVATQGMRTRSLLADLRDGEETREVVRAEAAAVIAAFPKRRSRSRKPAPVQAPSGSQGDVEAVIQ
jgi:hypothetical protein